MVFYVIIFLSASCKFGFSVVPEIWIGYWLAVSSSSDVFTIKLFRVSSNSPGHTPVTIESTSGLVR